MTIFMARLRVGSYGGGGSITVVLGATGPVAQPPSVNNSKPVRIVLPRTFAIIFSPLPAG
jgi:hypothetical protein